MYSIEREKSSPWAVSCLVPRPQYYAFVIRFGSRGPGRKVWPRQNRYAMRTCVCYLEMQRSRGKEGNVRFANEGHLRFVSVTFEFHCGCWKAKYASELFSFS